MILPAIVELFRYKLVSNIIILTCSFTWKDRIQLMRSFSSHGISLTFSCDPIILSRVQNNHFQGVIYMKQVNNTLLEEVEMKQFSHWYKWLIIGDDIPERLHKVRYDSDIVFQRIYAERDSKNFLNSSPKLEIHFDDVFVHPRDGAKTLPWAVWSGSKLKVTHNKEKILRRLNLKKFPLKIATPQGHYAPSTYNGSFVEYLKEHANPEQDSGIRCGYCSSSLILETLNATENLVEVELWAAVNTNTSMLGQLQLDKADLGGAILRTLPYRIEIMDYILPSWPFRVGFTYLADRASSNNMYVEPFSPGVWWTILGICLILAAAQRITARRPLEKEGAYIGVLASWLQQDAGAVPEGASGRCTFMVMSVSAMMVHAYYTSAVVSALMSAGVRGPTTLRSLADSRYSIASDGFDYMKYLIFDVDTNVTDLEYLKKKKKTSKLYQELKRGVELIGEGNTAYHSEYNQIYQHFNTFSDDQLCKLAYIDTFPETLSWITATKRGQWTDVFRSKGAWLTETGLVHHLVTRLKIKPPPCRAAFLAERVNFGDVAPVLWLTALSSVVAFLILGLEVLHDKVQRTKRLGTAEALFYDKDNKLF